MKKYLLFSGNCYYANGGWEDFRGSFDSLPLAENFLKALKEDYREWWQIVDRDTQEIVKSEGEAHGYYH